MAFFDELAMQSPGRVDKAVKLKGSKRPMRGSERGAKDSGAPGGDHVLMFLLQAWCQYGRAH